MKKIIVIFTALAICIIMGSCAHTNMFGFKDPSYKGKLFKRVLIFAMFDNLEQRKTIEDEVAGTFGETDCKAGASLDFISPLKSYNTDELTQVLKENKIDGVIFLSLTDSYTTGNYVPQQKTYKTKGQGTFIGDYYYYKSTTKVETSGGYFISKPVVEFESALFSVETGQQVWIAQSTTKGNAFAKLSNLAYSLGNNIVDNLSEEGLIK